MHTPLRRPALGLLTLLAASLSACAPIQQALQIPTVSVTSAQLTGLTLGYPATAHLSLQLQVNNPNRLPLNMSNIGGHFYLNGTDMGTVNLPNVALAAQSNSEQEALVDVPVSLNTAGIWLRVARGEELPYRIDGTFRADMGLLGTHEFGPFTLVQGSLKTRHLLP